MPKYIDVGAINWYDDLFMKGVNNSGVWVRYKDVESLIRNAPAADVEPVRHGRWVGMAEYCQHLFDTTGERYTMSQLGISHPHCNKCWNENESRTAFCPHCGAKMDEKGDSDAEVH